MYVRIKFSGVSSGELRVQGEKEMMDNFILLKILFIKFFICEYLNLHWIHIERIYNFYLKSLTVEIKLKFCSFQLFKFSEGFLETTELYNGEYYNRIFLVTCKQRSL